VIKMETAPEAGPNRRRTVFLLEVSRYDAPGHALWQRRHGGGDKLTHPPGCAADRPTDMRYARAPGNRAIL
jgi:hypothetical protein